MKLTRIRKFTDAYKLEDRYNFSHCLNPNDDKLTACGLQNDGSLDIQEKPNNITCPICPEYLPVKEQITAWHSQGIDIGPGLEDELTKES